MVALRESERAGGCMSDGIFRLTKDFCKAFRRFQ